MGGRVAVAVAVVVLGITGLFYIASHEPGKEGVFLPCVFHEVTGLHCPGCGMTRATHELTQLRFGAAFRKNPLAIVILPLVGVGAVLSGAAWVLRDRYRGPRVRLPVWLTWTFLAVVVSFWVLRNVPAWPFTLLAPH